MYSIVDIETTGGSSRSHGITEIAILNHDGRNVVNSFHTLINPECYIPPGITMLTGITNEMVRNAPKFYEVAKEIFEITEGSVFVAHSVNFDYSFIREAFKSLGGNFQRKKLCTARLSRKVFPGYSSYSLGNICAHLGIKINDRHRAYGDAEATVKLFERILKNDTNGFVPLALQRNSKEAVLPPNLKKEVFDALPEETGVYYFHNKTGKVIYVGKAVNIRQRIYSHFTSTGNGRLGFFHEIHDISFTLTGSELVALLLESDEIKKLYPLYNRMQKRAAPAFCLFEYYDSKGIHRLHAGRHAKGMQPVIGFRSFEEARQRLYRLMEKFELCPKCCGVQTSTSACFDYQIKKCRGVCAGTEPVDEYNERVIAAVNSLRIELGDKIIAGKGRNKNETSIVVIEKGTYRGFGYVDSTVQISSVTEACDYISPYGDNMDVQRILKGWTVR